MNTIETINVIEMADEEVLGLKSYDQNPEGKTEAKKLFKALAMEQGAEETEMDDFYFEGYYESGSYQLFLIESD